VPASPIASGGSESRAKNAASAAHADLEGDPGDVPPVACLRAESFAQRQVAALLGRLRLLVDGGLGVGAGAGGQVEHRAHARVLGSDDEVHHWLVGDSVEVTYR
jgi:hypothetical protein